MDVVELLPQLHFLRFPIGNVYLWWDSDGLTLVDCGLPGSGPAIAGAIRDLGHRPGDVRRLVLTHHHIDHVGAAAEVVGWGDVEVFAHRAEAPVIRGAAAGQPALLEDWERPIFDQVVAQVPADPPVPVRVDREVDDGDVLDFGGGAVAVAAPGHTAGSVALYLPEPQVLITGDTIARGPDGTVMLGVFNVDRAQAVASMQRQAALDAEVACFGHGEPLVRDAAGTLRAVADQLAG